MPSLSERIRFASTYITNKEGVKWQLKGREWVRDQFWLPADGFKLWRHKDRTPCDACSDQIGHIIEHPDDNPTKECQCSGLVAEPIIITILNLIRQDGKTFNSMAYALSAMLQGRNKSIALIAASEDQVKALFDENYRQAIERNPKLGGLCEIVGLRIKAKKTNSYFEALPASAKSVTGRTRTHLIVDEARDIAAQIAWALLPAIQTMHGVECPRGHVQLTSEQANAVDAPKECSACNERLTPWYGRIVILSSSGALKEDAEQDWLAELIDKIEREPHPNVHLFRSPHALNPAKSPTIVNVLQGVFGELESMRNYVEADLSNQWTRKHEPFITRGEIERVMDRTLTNQAECRLPCVGFLDTSLNTEKTSLVILAGTGPVTTPWDTVSVPFLQFWEPSRMAGGVINEIEVEASMRTLLPLYPLLRVLFVDVRGMPWAIRLVKNMKNGRVKPWEKSTSHESMAGWDELLRRTRERKITLPYSEEIIKELRGLTSKRLDNVSKVVDINRRKSHKDITEALAICCYLAALETMKRSIGLAGTLGTSTSPVDSTLRAARISSSFGRGGAQNF